MNAKAVGIWGLAALSVALCSWALAEPPMPQSRPARAPGRPATQPAPPSQPVLNAVGVELPPGTPPELEIRGRESVPAAERGAMGVPEPTWVKKEGKVHPDVRRALARQDYLDKNLERAPDWVDVIDGEGPEAFFGYVYVVVYLEGGVKEKATTSAGRGAIRQLQDSVLSKLTAVDFRGWFRFPDRPALLGYVNEAGLKKLADNKDVRAIGLDDKPYPEADQEQVYQHGSAKINGVLPKVHPAVEQAFERLPEVLVAVSIEGPDVCMGDRTPSTFRRGRALDDRVLGRLSALEANVTSLGDDVLFFEGWLTKAGLSKLANDRDVKAMQLPAPPPRPLEPGKQP